MWAEEDDLTICYPSDAQGDEDVPTGLVGSGFCNVFDRLDQGSPGLRAGEASLEANPGGEFMHGARAHWLHDDVTDGLAESDAMARSVWWMDDYIPSDAWEALAGDGPANE